ncbi:MULTISPECIES: hypothetical protein [unclassified Lacinutrix]
MKFIKLTIILLLTFSCSNEKKIAQFEKVLGKENSETLTYLVNDFESDFLKRQYPNLDTKNAYKQFLTDLKNGRTDLLKTVSKESRKRFEQSNLKHEIYSYVDSVWIENDFLIKKRFVNKSLNGIIQYNVQTQSGNIPSNFDKDSLIIAEMDSRTLNNLGKYWIALDSIKNQNEFIKEYYKFKIPMGFLHPEIVSNMMLNSDLNFSDYYIKRIIITDFIY